jgi:RND family efflux transporter MFP subunit
MNLEATAWRRDALEGEVLDEEGLARRRRRIRIAVIISVLLLVAVVAYLAMSGGDEKGQAVAGGDASKGGGETAPTVSVVVPGRQLVERTISATGTIGARREMPVGVAGEGGMVTRVLVEPGSWVGAGQILATIDRSVQVQTSAQLAAQINVARADARLAQQELERAQALVSRGFVSKADVERRIATRDAANARVRVAEAALGESRARTGRLDIRAPAAGLVLTRDVEPGQVVSSGSGVLFRLAKGGEMELLAQLSEADLAALSIGSRAEVTPVGTTQAFTGSIWQVSPVINEQTKQGIARIALAYNPALRPGGFASVRIIAGAQQAPILPESAILSDEKGAYVYLVGQGNKVERRAVKTGPVTEKGIAVIEGLNGNERVVLRAGGFLNPGEAVKPQRQTL